MSFIEAKPTLAVIAATAALGGGIAEFAPEARAAEPTSDEIFLACARAAFRSINAIDLDVNARANSGKAVLRYGFTTETRALVAWSPEDHENPDQETRVDCKGDARINTSLQITSGDYSMAVPGSNTLHINRGGNRESSNTKSGTVSFKRICDIARSKKQKTVRIKVNENVSYEDEGHFALTNSETSTFGSLKCNGKTRYIVGSQRGKKYQKPV